MPVKLVDKEWLHQEGIDVRPSGIAHHDRSAELYEEAGRPGYYGVTLFSYAMDPILGREWLGLGYTRESAIAAATIFVNTGSVKRARAKLVKRAEATTASNATDQTPPAEGGG